MRKKTLLVLLIVAVVFHLFIFLIAAYNLKIEIDLISFFKQEDISDFVEERIPYLVRAIIHLCLILFETGILLVILIRLIQREQLILTDEEKQAKKKEKLERQKKAKQLKKQKRIAFYEKRIRWLKDD